MCGIGGFFGVPGDQREIAGRLLGALRHRGPDDEGTEHLGQCGSLVHSRLAILDLSPEGHQPMRDRSADGHRGSSIAFNGEIYNYQALQRDLAAAGLPCRTQSDTEVILQSYRAWGLAGVERLRGMFAYCLADSEKDIAHLVRDRLGIKPLYLYRPPGGGVIFASELSALLSLGPNLVPPDLDQSALESYLAQGAVQGYNTLIKGITLLEPGTTLTVQMSTGREIARKTYWCLPTEQTSRKDRPQAVDELREIAREALRIHLISDVPIGIFLSGGIDSAALLGLASPDQRHSLRTLSIGFDVPGFDESDAAAATAAAFGTRHQTMRVSDTDIVTALPAALSAMDQPTVDGTNTYVVSRVARDAGLTVALSGLGGDELFGGYASFVDVPRAVKLRRWAPFGVGAGVIERMRRDRAGAKLAETLRRPPDPLVLYLLRRELFFPAERRSLHELPFGTDALTGLERNLLTDLRARSARLDEVNRISFFELEIYMRHMLLRDADAFSMAAPIEYRVPFLDHRLVDAAFRLPGEWKRPDPRPKPLLLDLVGASLPAVVWQSPKRGFSFPWGAWFSPGGALGALVRDAVEDTATWQRLGMNPKAVAAVWQRFSAGDRRVSPLQILAFVALQAFASKHRLRAT